MLQRNTGAIGALVLGHVLVAVSSRRTGSATFQAWRTLPPLAGHTVAGNQLDLPSAANRIQSLSLSSPSAAPGGRDAQNWAQRLSKDDPHLPFYTAIFLESVPRLFRSIAVSGIRSGMPRPCRIDAAPLSATELPGNRDCTSRTKATPACWCLVQAGISEWITSGPFADSLYLDLRKQIRAVN